MPRPRKAPPKAPKRRYGSGAVTQRPDGRYDARLPRDAEGRRLSRRFGTREAARAWLDSQLNPAATAGADETLGDYLVRWLERHVPTLAPQSVTVYQRAVRSCSSIAHYPVGELNHTHFQDVLARLLRDGLAPRTVAARRGVLHTALSDLVPDILPSNPLKRTSVQKPDPTPVECWDEDEQAAVLAAAVGHPLEPLVAIGLTAGLRIGELVALQWSDLGRDGVLTVQRNQHTRGKIMGPTKTRRIRRVTLPVPLLALLADYRARQPIIGRWICSRPDGQPWGPERLRRATTKLAEVAGVKRLHSHAAYRHSAAYRLMRAGVVVTKVAAILGHAKPSTSLNVYGHFLTGDDAAAVAAMGRIFDDSERLGARLGGDTAN